MLLSQLLEDYVTSYHIVWAIIMPHNCPPANIDVPNGHLFYRMTKNSDEIIVEDLKSYAEIDSDRDWGDQLPLAVGLSVFDNEEVAKCKLKLPYFRKQNLDGLCQLTLNPPDGVVKKTFSNHHYTWWRTTSFNISTTQMIQI